MRAVRREVERAGTGVLALAAGFLALIALLGLAWVLFKVRAWFW